MNGKLRNMTTVYLFRGELEMPFTAKFVMEHYVKEGRFTDQLYAGIADEQAVHFSPLPQA